MKVYLNRVGYLLVTYVKHCVKSVRIRSCSGPYFGSLILNMERYSVQMRENMDQNNSKYGQCLYSEGVLWNFHYPSVRLSGGTLGVQCKISEMDH